MRNGSLPTQILHDLRRRKATVIIPRMLVGQYGSPSAVSRALGKLAEAKQIEHLDRGIYRALPRDNPRLVFNRALSSPGAVLAPDKLIAVTMARPIFLDVTRLSRSYGVRRVLDEIAANEEIPGWLAMERPLNGWPGTRSGPPPMPHDKVPPVARAWGRRDPARFSCPLLRVS
jgi:hypothetical protein